MSRMRQRSVCAFFGRRWLLVAAISISRKIHGDAHGQWALGPRNRLLQAVRAFFGSQCPFVVAILNHASSTAINRLLQARYAFCRSQCSLVAAISISRKIHGDAHGQWALGPRNRLLQAVRAFFGSQCPFVVAILNHASSTAINRLLQARYAFCRSQCSLVAAISISRKIHGDTYKRGYVLRPGIVTNFSHPTVIKV